MHQWKRILVYFSVAIPIEDPTSNIETNSTPTDENEIAIDSRGNYSNCLIMHQYKKSAEKEIAFFFKKYMPFTLFLIAHVCFSFKLVQYHHDSCKRWYRHR